MKLKRTKCAVFAVLALACAPYAAQSQSYPTKPVRVLIGFSAGSELDIIGRMVSQKIAESLGQQFVVENRTGAGGTLAAAYVAAAAPDGYTLLINSVSHAGVQVLYSKLPYDTLRDFAGVSQLTSAPNVLVVSPAQGIKSAAELIARAKQKPGEINFGSAGVGSGTHMTLEQFRLATNIKVTHVPYKGVPEVLTDTATGRVHTSFAADRQHARDDQGRQAGASCREHIRALPGAARRARALGGGGAGPRLGPVVRNVRPGEDAARNREPAFEGGRPRARSSGDQGADIEPGIGAEAFHAGGVRRIRPRGGREGEQGDQRRQYQDRVSHRG